MGGSEGAVQGTVDPSAKTTVPLRGSAAAKAPRPGDFNALHAALGEGAATPASAAALESRGQASASYASARPHAIPKSYARAEDPNTPAVIVEPEAAPPAPTPAVPPTSLSDLKATMPMGGAQFRPGALSSGHMRAAGPPSPSRPFTPAPFPPAGPHGAGPSAAGAAGPIPRPPRRIPSRPTIVLRRPGPSRSQKARVFIGMLLVVVASGVAALALLRPEAFSAGAFRGQGAEEQRAAAPAVLVGDAPPSATARPAPAHPPPASIASEAMLAPEEPPPPPPVKKPTRRTVPRRLE